MIEVLESILGTKDEINREKKLSCLLGKCKGVLNSIIFTDCEILVQCLRRVE